MVWERASLRRTPEEFQERVFCDGGSSGFLLSTSPAVQAEMDRQGRIGWNRSGECVLSLWIRWLAKEPQMAEANSQEN